MRATYYSLFFPLFALDSDAGQGTPWRRLQSLVPTTGPDCFPWLSALLTGHSFLLLLASKSRPAPCLERQLQRLDASPLSFFFTFSPYAHRIIPRDNDVSA
jgi:hypothetical protein